MSGAVHTLDPAEVIHAAFRTAAANVSDSREWGGFPCLGMIGLHAEYLVRETVRAEEAFSAMNAERFAKHRDAILDRFAKLEAEVAEMRARIDGFDPTPPAGQMRAAA